MACFDDFIFVLGFIAFSLLIGIIGFRLFCGCCWYDSCCSAAMALGGNYTMNKGDRGLLFLSLYGLYGSIVFFMIATIIIARIFDEMRPPERRRLFN
jgi:hypothetical protein